jgi:hypothetical protein
MWRVGTNTVIRWVRKFALNTLISEIMFWSEVCLFFQFVAVHEPGQIEIRRDNKPCIKNI